MAYGKWPMRSSLRLYPAGGGWHKEGDHFMRTVYLFLSLAVLLAITACAPTHPAPDQTAAAASLSAKAGARPIELPGQKPDGSVLLTNQWSLRPAGKQVELGDFPINVAVHPDGRFAAVLQ